ncbi:hypothetical protein DVK85_10360 [Flavobacterium arcticum]|uniref:Lipoprotein n=1 Tax=Flavobacterium arcticum TaxID=1784713 RepID=A0A345HDF5_9FLAO|nr:hypothetical protein [Flavobacterium arcticum]AXG74615.1 hypothetical protein DVK85_10360 [Flavobacterium arcticum]KAF2512263.1 hypothetical protein E0W72_03305 [Flavobacterium arcticum]
MKKLFPLAVMMFFFVSCEQILKNPKNEDAVEKTNKKVVLGNDKDANGCVTSAGYRWSSIRNKCIRIFEEGYRLNAITELKSEGTAKSAFVIFEEKGNRAELYLPNTTSSILLEREKEGNHYQNTTWSLQLNDGYSLLKNGEPQYAGATIEEKQITGSDKQEN